MLFSTPDGCTVTLISRSVHSLLNNETSIWNVMIKEFRALSITLFDLPVRQLQMEAVYIRKHSGLCTDVNFV